MRSLQELLQTDDPAWPMVQEWIAQAKNHVEVLPPSEAARSRALEEAQVTIRSPMGAIIYETGGLLVDHGWLRILGSGHPRLPRALMEWNRACGAEGFLLVADDVAGGFFAINGGALGADVRNVYYFAPESLRWESLGRGYSDFLQFAFQGNLEEFYSTLRWPGWREEIAPIRGDQAISFHPPPWTSEGKDLSKAMRQPMQVAEAYDFNVNLMPQKLANVVDGTKIRLKFE